jgi:hypothetical protein
MTQPNPSASGNDQQDRLKRGARTTLDTRKQFQGTVLQADNTRVVVAFPNTDNLDQQLSEAGAGEAHLVFRIGHRAGPPDVSVAVFLNTPDADVNTPATGGFAGSVAFFEHGEHAGHSQAPFRLLLSNTVRSAGRGDALTATFVPVPFPGRSTAPQTLDVSASIHLIRSTVERTR